MYVYIRTGTIWTLQQTLIVPILGGGFGCSISINGDYLIVGFKGALNNNSPNGAALIYKRTGVTWSLLRVVRDPAGFATHDLGFCVSMNGNNILIGAPGASSNIPYPGFNPGKGRVLFLNIEE